MTVLKALIVWITTNCEKFLKRWEYPKNLYAGQEARVTSAHGTMNWFKFGKRVLQGYMLSPCLVNLYAENTMRNAGLDNSQSGIKFPRRNINNLRYADGTTLMAESEEKLKSLLMRVKDENEKAELKLNIQKTDYGIWSHHFMANRWGKSGNNDRFYFLRFQIHCRW